MNWHDFFYYALLKNSKLLIAVLGLIIAILVFMYAAKFGISYSETTGAAVAECNQDYECFENCGKCVSVISGLICEPNPEIFCICVNNRCELAKDNN